jgi:hypothetical protein
MDTDTHEQIAERLAERLRARSSSGQWVVVSGGMMLWILPVAAREGWGLRFLESQALYGEEAHAFQEERTARSFAAVTERLERQRVDWRKAITGAKV